MRHAVFLLLAMALDDEPHLHVHTLQQQSVGKDLQRIELELEVPPGFKVYRHSLKVLNDDAKAIQLDLPNGQKEFDSFSNETKEVYRGVFQGNLIYNTELFKKPNVVLQYQACSATVCFLPQSVSVDLSKFDRSWWENPAALAGNRWLFILAIFISGVAVSLTPCIYPLVPITLAVFARKSNTAPFAGALLYAFGLSACYASIGVFSAFSGGLFGQWMQLPSVVIGLSLFYLFLSLSYLQSGGLNTLLIPASWTQRIEKREKWGAWELIAFGLVSGLVASPCVTPALVGLLVWVAGQQDAFLGAWSLGVFGFGISFPLMLLALLTHWGHGRLPRSGAWMETVKRVLSLILLIITVLFARTLPNSALAFLAVVGSLLWVWGLVTSFGDVKKTWSLSSGRQTAALIFLGLTLIYLTKKFEKPSEPEALLCHDSASCQQKVMPGQWASLKANLPGGKVQPLQSLTMLKGTILIDFRADWCLSCKELEREVLTKDGFLEFSRVHSLRLIKWDLTQISKVDDQVIAEWNVQGLPTLLLLSVSDSGELEIKGRWTGLMSLDALISELRQRIGVK